MSLLYQLDDPIVCMGGIDMLADYGFDFRVEHIDGVKMTASEQFLRTAFYIRKHNLRDESLDIYYSYLAVYTKESRWVDLSCSLELEYQCSITDFLFIKNGRNFTLDPGFYPTIEDYANFIAKLASSKSCMVSWSRRYAIVS